MQKILITGAGGSASEGIYKLLKDQYELYFSDSNINSIPSIIPRSCIFKTPNAGKSWVNKIIKICNKKKINIIALTVDEELNYIKFLRKNLKNISFINPINNHIEVFNNKKKSNEFFNKKKISTPNTKEYFSSKIKFPILLKPIHGRGSKGIIEFSSKKKLNFFLETTSENIDNYIFQEKIYGQEWTIYMSANKTKKLLSVIPMKVILKRGITISAHTEYDINVINFCKKIHKKFPTSGVYNIQLIVSNNQCYVLEINPRLSTTVPLAIFSGSDPFFEFFQGNYYKPKILNKKTSIKRYWFNDLRVHK